MLFVALAEKGIKCNIFLGGLTTVYVEAVFVGDSDTLKQYIFEISNSDIDKYAFNMPENIRVPYKYNDFVPQNLLIKQFVEDYIDTVGMKRDLSCIIILDGGHDIR